MEFCEVETASGRVRGLINAGIRQFRAIPYGASTGGRNRFQRPQPPARWSGARDCFGNGPASPQAPYEVSHAYARLIQFDLNVAFGGMGEDCLHLSVWTPGTGREDQRAVVFCIHGGGFAICSGGHPMYDGTQLARVGDVVVVSVTHRLSSFGYLNLADLYVAGGDRWADAGVAGMLDLVAALEWVRDNIEHFGGDPQRVMICGQSGGGWKVSTLLGMPAARGLYRRAAVQSGSLLAHPPREASARAAHALLQQLGLTPATLDRIGELPWTALLAAQTAVGAHAFAPCVEASGRLVDPQDAAVGGEAVPLIVSTTLDDAGLFFDRFDLTEEQLAETLTTVYGERGAHLHATYRSHYPQKSPYLLHAQIVTDAGFRRFAHAQAEQWAARGGAAVYTYLWTWTCPAYDGRFGAAHAMDVSASLHNERDAILGSGSTNARRMCETLAASWVAFANTGNPNHPQIPNWPRFDAARRSTLVLGPDTRIEHDPDAALRKLWCDTPMPATVFG